MGKKTDKLIESTRAAVEELSTQSQVFHRTYEEYEENLRDMVQNNHPNTERIAKLQIKTIERLDAKVTEAAKDARKALTALQTHVRGKDRVGREETFNFIEMSDGLIGAFE